MYLSLAGSPAGIQQKTEFREEGWAAVSWFPFYIQQSFTGDSQLDSSNYSSNSINIYTLHTLHTQYTQHA